MSESGSSNTNWFNCSRYEAGKDVVPITPGIPGAVEKEIGFGSQVARSNMPGFGFGPPRSGIEQDRAIEKCMPGSGATVPGSVYNIRASYS